MAMDKDLVRRETKGDESSFGKVTESQVSQKASEESFSRKKEQSSLPNATKRSCKSRTEN